MRDDLGAIDTTEAGVAVDLLLSYRAVSQWARMVDLCGRFDKALQRTALVREQWALALNRLGRDREAEAMLTDLIAERGPSSETNALLGRIHKDRWNEGARGGRRVRRARPLEEGDRRLSRRLREPTGATPIPASTR